jgi:D-lactate dehydrogenase
MWQDGGWKFMKIVFFDTKPYEQTAFEQENAKAGLAITYLPALLNKDTVQLAAGHDAVCAFVNDDLSAPVLESLKALGVRLVAMRCAGFNNVDVAAAERLNLPVVRVPAYSPQAVAEHALALLLTLNRKIHRAYNRVRDGNFSLDGLVGFDLHRKTVGIIGTGKIGATFAKIMQGFDCRLLAYDPYPNPQLTTELGVTYVSKETLYAESHIISLHVPLLPETDHMIDTAALAQMKPETILINTSRGRLIESKALIEALKGGRIGGACLDVYEEEAGVFFHDLEGQILQDDVLARLISFPNVLITSHQAFLTKEALQQIAEVTLGSVTAFGRGETLKNRVAV